MYAIVEGTVEEQAMGRIIQVPIDDELLESLDALSEARRQPRAALIREACRAYLAREEQRRLDEAYVEGYRRVPEDPAIGLAQAALAPEVLPAETW